MMEGGGGGRWRGGGRKEGEELGKGGRSGTPCLSDIFKTECSGLMVISRSSNCSVMYFTRAFCSSSVN